MLGLSPSNWLLAIAVHPLTWIVLIALIVAVVWIVRSRQRPLVERSQSPEQPQHTPATGSPRSA